LKRSTDRILVMHQGTLVEIVDGLSGTEILATSNLNQLSAGVAVSTQRGTR